MSNLRASVTEYVNRSSNHARRINSIPSSAFVGTVTSYNPATHQVRCAYQHADDAVQDTGFILYLTPHAGAGYGDQDAPEVGTPVVLLSMSPGGDDFIAIGNVYDVNHQPPKPTLAPGERVIQGKSGAKLSLSNDGATPGDGLGSASIDARNKATIATRNGHSITADDTAQAVKFVTSGGQQTVMSAITNEISHVAQNVGLGDLAANIPASGAAITNAHLTTFEGSLINQRLTDMIFGATAMVTAGIPNAGAYKTALLALAASALGHIGVPTGSATVKVK